MKSLDHVQSMSRQLSRTVTSEYAFKRAFDFLFASIALVISLPLWIIFAIVIKIEDGGPVLYRQRRWGSSEPRIDPRIRRTLERQTGLMVSA